MTSGGLIMIVRTINMKEEIETLVSKVKSRINPSIAAADISGFISVSLREGKISLYEAYMINMLYKII